MKRIFFNNITKAVAIGFLTLFSYTSQAQDKAASSDFWSHVRFGGGFGASFGSDYTNVVLAPGAIYQFNDYFGLGAGLMGSYVKVDGDFADDAANNYKSWIYGGSLIGTFTPFEGVQLSTELEQVRVNSVISYAFDPDLHDNFWNTALFVGAGYNTGGVTIGVRYNLLFDKDKSVYSNALLPFVRVYF